MPWLYWSYNGLVVDDSSEPLEPPNLNLSVLDALVRPYPTVVNGTPTSVGFDAGSDTLELTFATRRPDGRRAPQGLETVVAVPQRSYPGGYAVEVVGADVTSRPCAASSPCATTPGWALSR